MQIEEITPEFPEHTLACTTFRVKDADRYTIATVEFTTKAIEMTRQIVNQRGVGTIVAIDAQGRCLDYGSVVFVNGEPALWPLGDLPGNIIQGVFQRCATKKEALAAHDPFVARVKAVAAKKHHLSEGEGDERRW